jgi:hypothetical protein
MSSKRYEVRVRYQGVSTYFVEANSDEEAAELARARYRNGEPDEATGSEYEEIVGADVRPIAPADVNLATRRVGHERVEATGMRNAEAAFKILTDRLLDAASRFTSEGGSDALRAYCAVLLDLGWSGDRAVSIRDTLRRAAFYAASGAVEETRIGARQLGNMVHGREWYDGDGRAG